jgi:hypothetical protein
MWDGAYRARPVIVSDIATDPLWADYRDLLPRIASLLVDSNSLLEVKVLGTFAIYFREPRTPTRNSMKSSNRSLIWPVLPLSENERKARYRLPSKLRADKSRHWCKASTFLPPRLRRKNSLGTG